tara:strand:+ start:20 stop:481 length:462 start_codon:yes stop_codon:yes gene_type:complete
MEYKKNKKYASSIRFSEDAKYERPKETITDTLQTSEEMRKKLDGYARITNIDLIPLHTHIRYITWKDGKERFTLGGKLRKVHPKYVVLYNQKFSWSVQRIHYGRDNKPVYETIFFNKLSEIENCKITLRKQQNELNEIKNENVTLKDSLRKFH